MFNQHEFHASIANLSYKEADRLRKKEAMRLHPDRAEPEQRHAANEAFQQFSAFWDQCKVTFDNGGVIQPPRGSDQKAQSAASRTQESTQRAKDAFWAAWRAKKERQQEAAKKAQADARTKDSPLNKFSTVAAGETARKDNARRFAQAYSGDNTHKAADRTIKDKQPSRASIYRSYFSTKHQLIEDELKTNPPRQAHHSEALKDGSINAQDYAAVFDRANRLDAMRARDTVASFSARNQDLADYKSGIFTDPGRAEKFGIQSAIMDRALTHESKMVTTSADMMRDSVDGQTPEDKLAHARRALIGNSKAAFSLGGADPSSNEMKAFFDRVGDPGEKVATPEFLTQVINRDRTQAALNGDDAKFAKYDHAFIQAKAAQSLMTEAQAEIDFIDRGHLFPRGQERAQLSQDYDKVYQTSHDQSHALSKSTQGMGFRDRMAFLVAGGRGLEQEAQAAHSDPFDQSNDEVSKKIIAHARQVGDRNLMQTAQSSMDARNEFHRKQDTTIRRSMVSIEHELGPDGKGEYLVSRAIGHKLEKVAEGLQQDSALSPEDRKRLQGIMGQFLEDKKHQMSAKEIASISQGLADILPEGRAYASRKVDLQISVQSAEMLKVNEQERWAEESRKTIMTQVNAQSLLDEGRAEANTRIKTADINDPRYSSHSLNDALGSILKREMLMNPDEHRRGHLQSALAAQERLSESGSPQARAQLVQGVLKGGRIHDERSAKFLADGVGDIEALQGVRENTREGLKDRVQARQAQAYATEKEQSSGRKPRSNSSGFDGRF